MALGTLYEVGEHFEVITTPDDSEHRKRAGEELAAAGFEFYDDRDAGAQTIMGPECVVGSLRVDLSPNQTLEALRQVITGSFFGHSN